MKEPTDHYEVQPDEFITETICAEDGKTWPCKTWQRWQQTDSYRLIQTEAEVKSLKSRLERLDKQAREERQKFHELELYVKGGLIPQMNDLVRYGKADPVTTAHTQDYEQYSEFGSHLVSRVAGRIDYNVRYTSVDGSVYENGECIERVLSSEWKARER